MPKRCKGDALAWAVARPLTVLLTSLLDTTGALGVGVVDGNGLLVQGYGLHGDQSAEKVAAYLSAGQARSMSDLVDDTLLESLLVGQRYCFHLRWLAVPPYFAYVMTENTAKAGSVRAELRDCSREVAALVSGSGRPTRERLEQPRQFIGSRRVR